MTERDSVFTRHEIMLQELFAAFPLFFKSPNFDALVKMGVDVN
jgi:hypothetical protein